MNKPIFVIYENDRYLDMVEIWGYTTNEEEANRIVDELEERHKDSPTFFSWQCMDECLDGIKPSEWRKP